MSEYNKYVYFFMPLFNLWISMSLDIYLDCDIAITQSKKEIKYSFTKKNELL